MRDPELILAETLEACRGLLLVVTGAGVSSASGIPTFRGAEPDAVWRVSDVEMATWEYFQRDPVGQWRWYLERFRATDSARPNPAHAALAELESWQTARGGRFLLVTQNIDTLHEAAGTRSLIKVHGSSDRVRCTSAGCRNAAPRGSLARERVDLGPFKRRPSPKTLPRCPDCGRLLRAHVLFFDECYPEHDDYRYGEVLDAAEEATTLLFVGTSFSVGITDACLRAAVFRRVPVLSIDPAGLRMAGSFGITALQAPAEKLLPAAVARLTSAVEAAGRQPR